MMFFKENIMNNTYKKALCAAVCAALAMSLVSCGKSGESAEIEIPILETSSPVYNTVKAEVGDISEKYYGEASYGVSHQMAAVFRRSGQIKEINVELNKEVKKGDVLYILETMKVMNEICAECDGKVSKILVNDGDALEYGQTVMIIS
jgi:acetyl-CoA carboxylase biotin carboxyl carrier protein